MAGLPGSSHLPTFSLGLSLQAQLSRACPREGIFSPSCPSSPSCYLVSTSGLSLFLLVHHHQRCISVLKLWTQLLHCCRFQSRPVTLTFFFFFLQHQKLLMHNSTNNPEMHQNSNDSHQRELDVKHCLLKTTHAKKNPLHSCRSRRFYLLVFVKFSGGLGYRGEFQPKTDDWVSLWRTWWCEVQTLIPGQLSEWQVSGARSWYQFSQVPGGGVS